MGNDDTEILRHAVLEALVERHPVAVRPDALVRRLERKLDFPFTRADVESALALLEDKGWVRWTPDDLGASRWYQATGEGVLQKERS